MVPKPSWHKVHRRTVRLDGTPRTVLSPRPSCPYRFATNRFHETWHVISDPEGAEALSRWMWAMAYQRRDALFVVDERFMVPNPFDADDSFPIVIVNSDVAGLDRAEEKDLQAAMPWRSPSEGTVTLQTGRLDDMLADPRGFNDRERTAEHRWNPHQQRRWIDRSHGLVVVAAPPPVLRVWAVELGDFGSNLQEGQNWVELDYPSKNGEVQVFSDFEARVARAVAARTALYPGRARGELSDLEREEVWRLQARLDPMR